MRFGRKLVLTAALAAVAAFAFTAVPAFADDDAHPEPDPETLHQECDWTVDKSASTTSLTLSEGQTSPAVTYTIIVSATCAGEHHDPSGDHHAAGGDHGDHAGTSPDHTVNECVIVDDSSSGTGSPQDLKVCLDDLDANGQLTIHYTRTFGPFHECGEFSDTNTVTVTSIAHGDPHAHAGGEVLASDSATIHITVPCVAGCTLTQGYWKTHSELGPAPYDNTWAQLSLGASTTFFLSGQTWFQVFWTPPAGGNVYYQLAHQYMAAVLNKLNGASSTAAVDAAIASATTFFNTYTPAQAAALGKTSAARKNALALASTLGSYNEGAIGPGHCDE